MLIPGDVAGFAGFAGGAGPVPGVPGSMLLKRGCPPGQVLLFAGTRSEKCGAPAPLKPSVVNILPSLLASKPAVVKPTSSPAPAATAASCDCPAPKLTLAAAAGAGLVVGLLLRGFIRR